MERLFAFVAAMLARVDQRKDEGATATEYALLVALIALVIALAVTFFGNELSSFFNKIGNTVQGWV